MLITLDSSEFQFFYALTVIVLAMIAFLVFYLAITIIRETKKNGYIEFGLNFCTLVFLIFLFIYRLLYFYFDFFLTKFNSDLYYRMPNIIVWKLAAFFGVFGFSILLYAIDKKVLKFKLKGFLSYISVATSLFVLFYPVHSIDDYKLISNAALFGIGLGAIYMLIFFYIGITMPELRKSSLIIAFGFIIYGTGGTLISDIVLNRIVNIYGSQIFLTLYLLYLISNIMGLILLTYGITINKGIEVQKASTKKSFKRLYFPRFGKPQASLIETLSLVRPSEITEEEIIYYKEQEICLVCKGKAIRFNIYVCPNCKALYCRKCALLLSDLENACWVCETPFDESKPVKFPEKKEEEVVIEEDFHKKGKEMK